MVYPDDFFMFNIKDNWFYKLGSWLLRKTYQSWTLKDWEQTKVQFQFQSKSKELRRWLELGSSLITSYSMNCLQHLSLMASEIANSIKFLMESFNNFVMELSFFSMNISKVATQMEVADSISFKLVLFYILRNLILIYFMAKKVIFMTS